MAATISRTINQADHSLTRFHLGGQQKKEQQILLQIFIVDCISETFRHYYSWSSPWTLLPRSRRSKDRENFEITVIYLSFQKIGLIGTAIKWFFSLNDHLSRPCLANEFSSYIFLTSLLSCLWTANYPIVSRNHMIAENFDIWEVICTLPRFLGPSKFCPLAYAVINLCFYALSDCLSSESGDYWTRLLGSTERTQKLAKFPNLANILSSNKIFDQNTNVKAYVIISLGFVFVPFLEVYQLLIRSILALFQL